MIAHNCLPWRHVGTNNSSTHKSNAVNQDTEDVIEPVGDVGGEKRIRQAIKGAAARHLDLLMDIQRTEHAVHITQTRQAILKSLLDELKTQRKIAKEAALETDDQLAKHRGAQGRLRRVGRFTAVSLRGKDDQATEAEQAYYSTLISRSRAEKRRDELQHEVGKIKQEIASLAGEVDQHGAALQYINQLYSEIFDGESHGFHAENREKKKYKRHEEEHLATLATLDAAERAIDSLDLLGRTFGELHKYEKIARCELEKTRKMRGLKQIPLLLENITDLTATACIESKAIVALISQPLDEDLAHAYKRLEQYLATVQAALSSVINTPERTVNRDGAHNAIRVVADQLSQASDWHAKLSCILKYKVRVARAAVQITTRALQDSGQALREIRQYAFEDVIGHGISPPPYQNFCVSRLEDYLIDHRSDMLPPPSYVVSRNYR